MNRKLLTAPGDIVQIFDDLCAMFIDKLAVKVCLPQNQGKSLIIIEDGPGDFAMITKCAAWEMFHFY